MSNIRQLTYARALAELERIINEIEAEETNVDTVAEKIKRATYLISFCKGKLRNVDEEVKKVLSEAENDAENNQD